MMNAKEYLNQAYRLDQRINSKIAQIAALNELATNCSSAVTGMPHNPQRSQSPMADAVCKIIDLQNEINRDIDRLLELKREIITVIKAVNNPEYQTLLELRYLCYKSWEQIAVEMNYGIDNVFKLYRKSLAAVRIPQKPTVQ